MFSIDQQINLKSYILGLEYCYSDKQIREYIKKVNRFLKEFNRLFKNVDRNCDGIINE
jgi:hypothetical protein